MNGLSVELQKAAENHITKTRTNKRGRPYANNPEGRCSALMAVGLSTRIRREYLILNRKFMLKEGAQKQLQVPN